MPLSVSYLFLPFLVHSLLTFSFLMLFFSFSSFGTSLALSSLYFIAFLLPLPLQAPLHFTFHPSHYRNRSTFTCNHYHPCITPLPQFTHSNLGPTPPLPSLTITPSIAPLPRPPISTKEHSTISFTPHHEQHHSTPSPFVNLSLSRSLI